MSLLVTQAINQALDEVLLSKDRSVCIGLGINDPKRIFNTTQNLVEKYGNTRVIEPPTSENALTGIAFGLCLRGYSVCLTHQRLDFSLLSFDQIINTISKWKFMFGEEKQELSCLIRMIVGRGWGQGPTHSQSYHSFLSSLPGLKVLYPFDSDSAYHSVKYGMNSGNPTVLIEHRWLHNSIGDLDKKTSKNKYISSLIKLAAGTSITIFTYGYMVPEAIKATEILKEYNISVDLFVAVDLSDFDLSPLLESLNKTNNITLIECYTLKCSIVNDISTKIITDKKTRLGIDSFNILALEQGHESTSFSKTKTRYNSYIEIVENTLRQLNKEQIYLKKSYYHDIPGEWFKGPF